MKKLSVPHLTEDLVKWVRNHRVMMDEDLAFLYGVKVKVLVQAVKRNRDRFPVDFVFQLTKEEAQSLRSQIVTLKKTRGSHRKYLPHVFTEQGVAMLSSVLRSKRAVQVNIAIVRTFVRLRQILSHHSEMTIKLNELERRVGNHDENIAAIIEAIRELTARPERPIPKIGFHVEKK